MSKQLKLSGGLAETKNQMGRIFDETCRFYTCICNERKKIGEVIMSKVGTSRKSKTYNIENEKQDPFQFASV